MDTEGVREEAIALLTAPTLPPGQRDVIIDGRPEKDDAILEKARVDVVGALALMGFFDDGWNEKLRHK